MNSTAYSEIVFNSLEYCNVSFEKCSDIYFVLMGSKVILPVVYDSPVLWGEGGKLCGSSGNIFTVESDGNYLICASKVKSDTEKRMLLIAISAVMVIGLGLIALIVLNKI